MFFGPAALKDMLIYLFLHPFLLNSIGTLNLSEMPKDIGQEKVMLVNSSAS